MPLEASGLLGFVAEYLTALFYEMCLAWKVYARHGIDVVHVCNPPDLLFLVALPFKLLGARFVLITTIFVQNSTWRSSAGGDSVIGQLAFVSGRAIGPPIW